MNKLRAFWDLLLIITIGIWILGLYVQGYLSPQLSGLFLVGLVFFIAMIMAKAILGR